VLFAELLFPFIEQNYWCGFLLWLRLHSPPDLDNLGLVDLGAAFLSTLPASSGCLLAQRQAADIAGMRIAICSDFLRAGVHASLPNAG